MARKKKLSEKQAQVLETLTDEKACLYIDLPFHSARRTNHLVVCSLLHPDDGHQHVRKDVAGALVKAGLLKETHRTEGTLVFTISGRGLEALKEGKYA